jgi:hypothetical protein
MTISALTPAQAAEAARLDAVTEGWSQAAGADAPIGVGAVAAVPSPLAGIAPALHAEGAVNDHFPGATGGPPSTADAGQQAACAQSGSQPPQVQVSEPVRPADTLLPHASYAGSEFAIPADQLVPATLTGLQVEGTGSWPLLHRPLPEAPPHEARERRGRDQGRGDSHPCDEPEADAAPPDATAKDGIGAQAVLVEEPAPDDWCRPLTQALRAALASRLPPRALQIAAEQWRRGRCVVLACPQAQDSAGPAWAFVLWPRPGTGGQPALRGLRVPARLQWSAPPHGMTWCHVRVVKEHHPRRGRQLVTLDTAGAAPPCEVQLGPVLARSLRWCEVCVRIDAVYRFWSALGEQWSASVVVCSCPLVPPAGAGQVAEAVAC